MRRKSQIILVGYPSAPAWETVIKVRRRGDKVALFGDSGTALPRTMKIRSAKALRLIPNAYRSGVAVAKPSELEREVGRIERSLGVYRSLVMTSELVRTLALVGILVRKGKIQRLLCIPGTPRKRRDFKVLQIVAPEIYRSLEVEVLPIPRASAN